MASTDEVKNNATAPLVSWGVNPPPWILGDNESLDIAYFKVMRALQSYGYTIAHSSDLALIADMKKTEWGAD